MRKIPTRLTAEEAREALKGIPGAQARDEAGAVIVEHGDEVDGAAVDFALQGATRASLRRRLRGARDNSAEQRDALVDAVALLLGE